MPLTICGPVPAGYLETPCQKLVITVLLIYWKKTALIGSREEYVVAGFFVFSHIRMSSYLSLG